MADDPESDDGGIHRFWAFVAARRLERNHPALFDLLEDADALRDAIALFEAS